MRDSPQAPTINKIRKINYGIGSPARIDGIIDGQIAIEVESRVSKQVRGAVLDLICHFAPKKLLILLPVHMSNPEETRFQSINILQRFIETDKFQVVVLKGSGENPCKEDDVQIVLDALQALGFQP